VAFYTAPYFFLNQGPGELDGLLTGRYFCVAGGAILVAGVGANLSFGILRFPLTCARFTYLAWAYGFADFAAVSSLCWIASMRWQQRWGGSNFLPAMMVVSCCLSGELTLERLIVVAGEVFLNRRARELLVGIVCALDGFYEFLNPALAEVGDPGTRSGNRAFGAVFFVGLPSSLAGTRLPLRVMAFTRPVLAVGGLMVWSGQPAGLLWVRYRAQYLEKN